MNNKAEVTMLRRIKKEIREQKRKLLTIFEATPVGLALLDEDLAVKRVNSALTGYFGKSAENMINKRICRSFCCVNSTKHRGGCGYESDCKDCSLRNAVSEVIETGEAVYGKEVQQSFLIGGKIENAWFRVNSVPIIINGSKRVILVIDDITPNKRTEEELTKSRDFYLKLFEDFPALIRRSGQDAKRNYFNRSWLGFTGRTIEEELGDGWVSGVHPDDMEMCFNTYVQALGGRKSFDMEYRLRRYDGEYRWISDSGRPFYDAEGVFCGYIGSCYDITEKKHELEMLSKYQLLSKHANDIIFFIDQKGNIVETNEAAISKYGYTREEFKALTLSDLRKADGVSIINEHLDEVWTSSIMFNTTHFRKDGSSFPVEASWSGAEIGNNRMILCVVRDITERMQLQTYLEDKNKELHYMVERLKQTQSQLIQQEQFAAIGILAAGVAHEINNPLGFIMSNIDTLDKYCGKLKKVMEVYAELRNSITNSDIEVSMRVLTEIEKLEIRHNMNAIKEDIDDLLVETKEGLHRISKIVNGLRGFSRVDDLGKLIDYDLNEGIENSIMVANNEIKYYADIEKNFGDIKTVTLPGNQMNQVLLNVIINAVYAIKERQDDKRGLIKISTYKEEGYVCCEIADNGIGIPEVNLSRVFTPFFTTKPVGQGTGLGLSISYDFVVNQCGGEMKVKSTPGKGTVFIIKLPVK